MTDKKYATEEDLRELLFNLQVRHANRYAGIAYGMIVSGVIGFGFAGYMLYHLIRYGVLI